MATEQPATQPAETAEAVRVIVVDGFAVFDGEQQRTGGSVLEVDTDTAERLLRQGWVTSPDLEQPAPSSAKLRGRNRR